jgi:hypothetical protein
LVGGKKLSSLWAGRRQARLGVKSASSALVRLGRSPRGRLAVSLGLAIVTTAILALAGRSLLDSGWPLAHGNPGLVAAAGLLFVLAYGFKAYGWRRLFRANERPGPLALAAAGGGASIMGVVLPGRFDEVVRIAIVRRYPGCPVGVRGLCLSLLTLGLIDTVALSPLATAAAAFPARRLASRSPPRRSSSSPAARSSSLRSPGARAFTPGPSGPGGRPALPRPDDCLGREKGDASRPLQARGGLAGPGCGAPALRYRTRGFM